MNNILSKIRLAHYTRFLGNQFDVYESGNTSAPNILSFPPGVNRHWYTFITDGMSNNNQPLERFALMNAQEWKRIELVFYLSETHNGDVNWVVETLARMAQFPWQHETFIAWYHTYSEVQPPTELGKFRHILFLPPYLEDSSFDCLQIEESTVHILWGVPITNAELDFQKQNRGKSLETRLWPVLQINGPGFNSSRSPVV